MCVIFEYRLRKTLEALRHKASRHFQATEKCDFLGSPLIYMVIFEPPQYPPGPPK